METVANVVHREPWNKGKIVGQKAPHKACKVREVRGMGDRQRVGKLNSIWA